MRALAQLLLLDADLVPAANDNKYQFRGDALTTAEIPTLTDEELLAAWEAQRS